MIIFLTHQCLQIPDPCKTKMGSQFLVMACLSINTLVPHVDNLRVFMSQFKDIDILAKNETKLDATIEEGKVYLPGYDAVRKDHKSNGRNDALFVLIF